MNQSKVTGAIYDGLLLAGVAVSGAVWAWDNHTEPIDVYQPDGSFITMTRARMGTSIVSRAIGMLDRAQSLRIRMSAARDFFTAKSFG